MGFIITGEWDYGRIHPWNGQNLLLTPGEGAPWLSYELAQIGSRKGRGKLGFGSSQQSKI